MLKNNWEIKRIIDINEFIHDDQTDQNDVYHKNHIELVKQYALILNKRLGLKLSEFKLAYIAYAHDLLKEQGLNEKRHREYHGHVIPENPILYVRQNLDVLEKYGMDEYFNSSAQYHPLAAAIFLIKEWGLSDPEIIYPIMFHSCPIMSIYETLPVRIKHYIDIIMLSDKLSSNYLRINWREVEVECNLDLAVFGNTGNEMNYSLGLFLARIIADKGDEEEGRKTMQYYTERLCKNLPWINPKKITMGGVKKWPKRKSPLLKTPY